MSVKMWKVDCSLNNEVKLNEVQIIKETAKTVTFKNGYTEKKQYADGSKFFTDYDDAKNYALEIVNNRIKSTQYKLDRLNESKIKILS